jgi:pyruvate dehydrogenase E1 component alpha subunit
MAELFGKKTGICRGQGGSMHMFSAKHNLVRRCYRLLVS